VSSGVSAPSGRRTLSVTAPVQTDRTGDSIKLLLQDMRDFPTTRPVDATELNRVTDGNVRGLPNRFETNEQVLRAIVTGQRLGRPDDYSSTLPDRYRAIDAAAIDGAAKRWLHPEGLVFVVVGDRALVEPQLKDIGLPIEAVAAP
jgi:predicted Zn-dependent peptidase